jgi:hypothetical protein
MFVVRTTQSRLKPDSDHLPSEPVIIDRRANAMLGDNP